MRSTTENPDLVSMVRSVGVSWTKADGDVHTKANEILGKLQHLQTVMKKAQWDTVPFPHEFFEANQLHHLRNATVFDRNFTTENLAKYMFVDQIKSLKVFWVQCNDVPRLRREFAGRSSPLHTFDLDPSFHTPEETLKEVLKWPKNPQRLRCGLPG
jgi:hypothetical protein